MTRVFPSILPGRDFVDERYTRRELERMEWDELRQIAARHPTDDVHGRMGKHEMIDGLTDKKRV